VGKVSASYEGSRTITLKGPEGKKKTFEVDKSVKVLDKLKKGDDITLRVTDALAITVVKL
jgi:hypothetical protein